MPPLRSKTALLDDLRRRIAHLEHPVLCRETPPPALALGVPEIDAHLPWGGLAPAALHEIVPAQPGDGAAALGFAAGLLGLAARKAAVLWCGNRGDLYAPGLKSLGLCVDNLIIVNAAKDRDLLWAMEEGLRSGALAAVLGEIRTLTPTAARRLQLAAEDGGSLAFLAHNQAVSSAAPPGMTLGMTVGMTLGMTRWQVAAAASRHALGNWPGKACWRVTLQRCRGAESGQWFVEWHDDDDTTGKHFRKTRGFRLAAALRDGSLRPAAQTAWETAQQRLPLRAATGN